MGYGRTVDEVVSIRALAEAGIGARTWSAACELLDRTADESVRRLIEDLAPELGAWPDALRVVPDRWTERVIRGEREDRVLACRALSVARRPSSNVELERLLRAPCIAAVRMLDLSYCDIDDSRARFVARLLDRSRITTMRVSGNPLRGGVVGLLCSGPPRLAAFHADGCKIGNDDVGPLRDCRLPSGLRVLTLARNLIGADGVGHLLATHGADSLRELSLNGNVLLHAGAAHIGACGALASLRVLDIAHTQIGSTGVAAIAQGAPSRALERLSLGWVKADDAAAFRLADSPGLRDLTQLELEGNQLTAAGLRAIVESGTLTRLRSLRLDGNAFGDDAVAVLTERQESWRFDDLVLSEDAITADGRRQLRESHNLDGVSITYL
jgi:hypothetical protein